MALPKCGIYRTTVRIGDIEAGRLVYFHNHGDPGPGLYLPEEWQANRALFSEEGLTLPEVSLAKTLERLPLEGFYRVKDPFHCCEKKCQKFQTDMLVQLGYDGDATSIVFVPEMISGHLAIPEEGVAVDDEMISKMALLKVAIGDEEEDAERIVH